MQVYTFEVKGREPYTCTTEGPLEAMGCANDHFRASALPQGVWMDAGAGSPHGYYWAEGNFFD